jgi:predicted amino acid-binding ACT domain protein
MSRKNRQERRAAQSPEGLGKKLSLEQIINGRVPYYELADRLSFHMDLQGSGDSCFSLVSTAHPGERLSEAARQLSSSAASEDKSGSVVVVTLAGPDRPGILGKVSRLLAEHNVNITSMIVDEQADRALVSFRLAVPDSPGTEKVHAALRKLAAEDGFELSMKTNQRADRNRRSRFRG